MGKSAPAAPPTPDLIGQAKVQGEANKETAITQGYINNPNVYGPTGSQTVTFGANNQPTITQTLTPEAQKTFEAQQRVQKALAILGEKGVSTAQDVLGQGFKPTVGALQTKFDTSNLPPLPVNSDTTAQEAIMSRLEPTLTRRSNQLEQTLANQGLTVGGEAYRNAKLDEARAQNDLLTQAALQGINLGTGIRAQGFNEEAARVAAENAAKQQQLQTEAYLRQQPLNEITGLMSGSQIMMPSFQGYQPAQITPPPIMQGALAQNQAAMDQYGIQSANYNAGNAGLYNLLGTAGTIGAKAYGIF